jgi:hypothetical protein
VLALSAHADAQVGDDARQPLATVSMQDLMVLPRDQTAQLLQRLFANAATLKLGFGLAGDLWAVSQVQILGCVSIIIVWHMMRWLLGCNYHY